LRETRERAQRAELAARTAKSKRGEKAAVVEALDRAKPAAPDLSLTIEQVRERIETLRADHADVEFAARQNDEAVRERVRLSARLAERGAEARA
jgi:hypothetical protein